LPVVADACQVHNERMPVCIEMMGGQSVSVLRDTGCSTVVVKTELVDDQQTRNCKYRQAAAKPAACAKPLMLSTLGRKGKRKGRRGTVEPLTTKLSAFRTLPTIPQ